MPKVPVLDTPSVMPDQLPGVRQQTPMRLLQRGEIGPGQTIAAGRAMSDAGAAFARIATAQQIDQNESRVKDYDAQLMASTSGVLYGNPDDPSSGYLNKRGKDAVDAYQGTVDALRELPQKLSSSLGNPAQQRMAQQATALRMQAALEQAGRHYNEQLGVYQDATSQTRIKAATDNAVQAFNPLTDTAALSFDHENPASNSPYQQYLATVQSEARSMAARKGLADPDVQSEFVRERMAGVYLGTLSHLMDGGSKGAAKGMNAASLKIASDYFDAVKGNLTAEQQDKVRTVMQAGAVQAEALNLAIDIGGSVQGIGAQEKELNRRFKAGDISAETHDMALQKLRADNAQRRSEEAEQDKSVVGQAWSLAQSGKTLADMPPSTLAYIKQRGLGPNIESIFKRDTPAVDDSAQYYDLSRQAADDPAGFSKLDLATLSGQLTKSHFDHLVQLQTSIGRQDVKAMEANKVLHNAIAGAKSDLLAAGFDLTPKEGTNAAKQLAQFQGSLLDALTAAQDTKGAPLTDKEARDITLGRLRDEALSGTGHTLFGVRFGQQHKPVYQMTPEERAKPFVVPDKERQQIESALRRAGVDPTEDNVQRAYKRQRGIQ